jgi:TolB-like protein/Tfp pilus assembly protein PilF
MGEVFRATDTRLGRDVALKILPPEMASDADRLARFQREARAVAALNHPNVVTLYSVEEAEGIHFITMELIEGQALDRMIPAGGLPAERIVEIAGAIAEALTAAHDKGIVHRDLKPANVMVTTEGRVKVLDFGLAKEFGGPSASDATVTSPTTPASPGRTEVGVVMGTPAYMSPEQVSGRALDHRTDIFSLGVLLHEMATGRRPFEAESAAELISAILRDQPVSVLELRPELPADLARVIRRCLEKDPRHRVQTARDVSNEFRELARLSAGSAATPSGSVGSRIAAGARAEAKPDSSSVRADEGFWVAVLPFKYSGGNAEVSALAEGLTDDIITGMSRFSYLRVIARSSTERYAQQAVDLRGAAKELGARYVMDGSIRQAGGKIRIAVRLVDSVSGAHLWAETYERAFNAEAVFELQDELVPRIVSSVADMHGVLPRSMSETLRSRPPEQLSPYEAVLRSFAYYERYTPEELTAARAALEMAVKKSPAYADAWAMLSVLCAQDYVHGYDLQASALETAATAARRAVQLGPSNHLAYYGLSQVLSYQKEYDSLRDAVERTVTLNPMDGNSVAHLGELLTYSGNVERGMELSARAKQLNPNGPGWYWYGDFYHAFSQHDYRSALSFALKVKLRGNPLAPMFIAAAAGQLGDSETGAKAVADLVKFRPELPALMPSQVAKIWNPEYAERFLEGLRKAGLEIPEAGAAAPQAEASKTAAGKAAAGNTAAKTSSGQARAEEGFWVAVLPFKYRGGDADLAALADGLTDEVITGLSRFSYLQVIARGSTAKYSGESQTQDVRAIGKELGARYVMEGNLRQAGTKLRLVVQLVDTGTGAHLWAETYEREFRRDAVFDLQDDLAPRIVSTVADQYGVLPRMMSDALSGKNEELLTPHEALLRAFRYFGSMTPVEHAAVRRILEQAVREAPDQADCWALLAIMYAVEFADGFNPQPNSLDRALSAAQRAVDLAPAHALTHYSLAWVHFFRKERSAFYAAAERAMALNPMDGSGIGILGIFMQSAGEPERGLQMTEMAMRLNPNYPGVLRFAPFHDAYFKRKYGEALEAAVRLNLPGFFFTHSSLAAALGQLGQREAAQKAVNDLLALRPDFARAMRKEYAKWYTAEEIELVVEGLRKAGLEIEGEAGSEYARWVG